MKSKKDKEKKELILKALLEILKEKYEIEEEDFLSAELGSSTCRSGKRLWYRPKHDHGLWTGRQNLRIYFSDRPAAGREPEIYGCVPAD